MGIRTPVSRNLAMTLGGLRQGVTPLDMAHAYETFARGGKLAYGTLSPGAPERAARAARPSRARRAQDDRPLDDGRLRPIELPNGDKAQNQRRERRVLSTDVAGQVTRSCSGVVQSGTAARAQIPGVFMAGKTGHDGELRRRVVRRLDAGDHGRRVGRLPGRAAADGDRVRRRAGGRRHLPGAHLQGLRRAGASTSATSSREEEEDRSRR